MRKRLSNISNGYLSIVIIIAILITDQVIKIAVKTNMYLGEAKKITNWFYIQFIENNGMAYGMTFVNKLVLSLFRIVLVCLIGLYIYKLVKEKYKRGYILCLSVILAGAAGNIFDSLLYGLIFNESTPFTISELVPFGTGYAPMLYGKVVDMFYFPIIVTTWPDWVPYYGGEEFIFFSPIFNFADACISVGAVVMLIFYRKDLEMTSNTLSKARKAKNNQCPDENNNN